MLTIYRWLYRITGDRKWVVRYLDVMEKRTLKEIEQIRKAKED